MNISMTEAEDSDDLTALLEEWPRARDAQIELRKRLFPVPPPPVTTDDEREAMAAAERAGWNSDPELRKRFFPNRVILTEDELQALAAAERAFWDALDRYQEAKWGEL